MRLPVVVRRHADTHVPGPPYCTYGLRVPASCVLYVPEAQGSSPRGGHYCRYRVPCHRRSDACGALIADLDAKGGERFVASHDDEGYDTKNWLHVTSSSPLRRAQYEMRYCADDQVLSWLGLANPHPHPHPSSDPDPHPHPNPNFTALTSRSSPASPASVRTARARPAVCMAAPSPRWPTPPRPRPPSRRRGGGG